MSELPPARRVLRQAPAQPAYGQVVLSKADRAIRVRALTTTKGETFIVGLAERQSLEHCFGFELEDGRCIEIVHADESLLEVRGNLVTYAWHIGTLNLPCQIEQDRLLVPAHPDVATLLEHLGATIRNVDEPFSPEPALRIDHEHGQDCQSCGPQTNAAVITAETFTTSEIPKGDPF